MFIWVMCSQIMEIAVVDYKGGNVQSVLFALERLGAQPILTADPEV